MNTVVTQKTGTNLVGRIVLGSTCVITGAAFFVFGLLLGGWVLGVGLALVGFVAILGGVLYFWRGNRLEVRIVGDDLVVGNYFKEEVVPLGSVKRVFRSVDATVIETSQGMTVIDDGYFESAESRSEFFDGVMERVKTLKS